MVTYTNIVRVPEDIFIALANAFSIPISSNINQLVINNVPGKPYVKIIKDNTIDNLMTREEALSKLDLGGPVNPETFLIWIEALGLIKFKEEIPFDWIKQAQTFAREGATIEVNINNVNKMCQVIKALLSLIQKDI